MFGSQRYANMIDINHHLVCGVKGELQKCLTVLLMSHFTALLEREGGLGALISCFSNSIPFCSLFITSSSSAPSLEEETMFTSALTSLPLCSSSPYLSSLLSLFC